MGVDFDEALVDAMTGDGTDSSSRQSALENWRSLPGASFAHPREEHLAPLFVVAGAAGDDRCEALLGGESGVMMGAKASAFRFG